MLDYMRKNSQSFVIYLFMAIIIVIFVFEFGPQSSGWRPGEEVIAATLEGGAIDGAELDMEYTRHYGFSFARNQELKDVLKQKQELLEDLIKVRLLAAKAQEIGLRVSPDELREYILDKERNLDQPSFSPDGKFDADLYRRVIQSGYRVALSRYEDARRRDLLARKLLHYLSAQVRVSEAEMLDAYSLRNTKVSLEFVAFSSDDEPEPATVNEEEAKTWAGANTETVKAYYEAHKAEFQRPKELLIRQIFVKALPDDAPARAAAKAKAEGLRKQILEGGDMTALASEHSDHFSYKSKGGNMGWQTAGNNDEAFDKAAFALAKDAVSEVVETDVGFYILRAEEIREPVNQSLEQATPQIGVTLLTQQRRSDGAKAHAQATLSAAREGASSLTDLVAASNIKAAGENSEAPAARYEVAETGEFSQDGGSGQPDKLNPFRFRRAWDTIPRIGRSAELSRAAFALTQDKPWATEPLLVAETWYIFRLKERQNADKAGFTEAKPVLADELSRAKVETLMGNWERMLFGRAFQRRLFGGESPLGTWLQTVISQAKSEAAVQVRSAMFQAPTPAGSTSAPATPPPLPN